MNNYLTLIDEFVMGLKRGGRQWIAKDTLYTHPKKGGIGMIDINEFISSIKCSWMKRYAIGRLDDHWADMLNTRFNLTADTKHQILEYGPEPFNQIIKTKPTRDIQPLQIVQTIEIPIPI